MRTCFSFAMPYSHQRRAAVSRQLSVAAAGVDVRVEPVISWNPSAGLFDGRSKHSLRILARPLVEGWRYFIAKRV
jgi:hypothetical protein